MRNQGAKALKFVMAEMLDEQNHDPWPDEVGFSLELDARACFKIRAYWFENGQHKSVEQKLGSLHSIPEGWTMTNLLRDLARHVRKP